MLNADFQIDAPVTYTELQERMAASYCLVIYAARSYHAAGRCRHDVQVRLQAVLVSSPRQTHRLHHAIRIMFAPATNRGEQEHSRIAYAPRHEIGVADHRDAAVAGHYAHRMRQHRRKASPLLKIEEINSYSVRAHRPSKDLPTA